MARWHQPRHRLSHHRRHPDERPGPATLPHEAPNILKGLTNAPVKKLMLLDAGANPSGDVCGPTLWHGFIGMEQEAVDAMVGWMRSPQP